MRTKKFVIGRYYFNSLFKEKADGTFLKDLMGKPFIEEKRFGYALGNFNSEHYDKHSLLRGTFGRVRKGRFAETYDKGKKEFKKSIMPETADTTLEFTVDHPNHLIYLEYSSTITPSYFAGKLKKIYADASSLADLEVDFIFIEGDLYETVKKWKSVKKVVFKKLRPSNPSSLDYYADIEKLLKETNSTDTDIEFKIPHKKVDDNNERGLNYESKLIKQGMALSAHGYGVARLEGNDGQKEVEIESKRFLKKVEIDFSEEGSIKKIIQTSEEINKGEKYDK